MNQHNRLVSIFIFAVLIFSSAYAKDFSSIPVEPSGTPRGNENLESPVVTNANVNTATSNTSDADDSNEISEAPQDYFDPTALYRGFAPKAGDETLLEIPSGTPKGTEIVEVPVNEKKAVLQWGGYIQAESIWDSRLIQGSRDGQRVEFPLPYLPAVNGKDLNAVGLFDMYAIQTRINALIIGPSIQKAKSSGYIEWDFLGISDTDICSVRLRLAYMVLEWERTRILFGQEWVPFFIKDCWPETIDFNNGFPFEIGSRNPQIRIGQKMGKHWSCEFSAMATVLDKDTGPLGPDSQYLRHSMVPVLDAMLRYDRSNFFCGVGLEFRSIMPRIVTDKGYKTHERNNSVSAIAYAKYHKDKLQVKAKIISDQNLYSYVMFGGYGITSVDPKTDVRTYSSLRNLDFWMEIIYGDKVVPALFWAVSKNFGMGKQLAPLASVPGAVTYQDLLYGRGTNIDWAFRVQPRVSWNMKNLTLATELEVTHAVFGPVQRDGTVRGRDPETDYRLLAAAYYYF